MPTLKPDGGIRVKTDTTYLFDPSIAQGYVDEAEEAAAVATDASSAAQAYANDSLAYSQEAGESLTAARAAASLAQDWATKTNGTVGQTSEYSSKHYAGVAEQHAEEAEGWAEGNNNHSAKHYSEVAAEEAETAEAAASAAEAEAANARAWATQMDSPVQYDLYSAKKYATDASSSAQSASDSADAAAGSAAEASTAGAAAGEAAAEEVLDTKIDKRKAVQDITTYGIAEIPQNLKIEYTGTTITLKAGSIITNPDGSQLQLSSDLTYTTSLTGTHECLLFPRDNGTSLYFQYPSAIVSGATDPKAGETYHIWYDTTNKVINRYTSNASTPSQLLSFPVCKFTVTQGVITSVDTVFNGIGWCGNSFFKLPNVKYFVPAGKNEDGTYKTVVVQEQVVRVQTRTYAISDGLLVLFGNSLDIIQKDRVFEQDTPPTIGSVYERWYNTKENKCYYHSVGDTAWTEVASTNSAWVVVGTAAKDASTYTSFDIYEPSILPDSYILNATKSKVDKERTVNDFATNCIINIPQDINLELASDGTLTLKSGSRAYRPDGNQYQLASDITLTLSVSGKYLIYSWSLRSLAYTSVAMVYSGTTAPTGTGKMLWYDTTNNMIKESSDGGSTWEGNILLPFAIVTVSNGAISSIDKVFNGFGYVGHHAFMLPGVTYLVADGFNSDGTLKSRTHTKANLSIVEMTGTGTAAFSRCIYANYNGSVGVFNYNRNDVNSISELMQNIYSYVKELNKVGTISSGVFTAVPDYAVVMFELSGQMVTKFEPRPVSGLSGSYVNTALGYVPEKSSNKVTSMSGSSTDTQYPSAKSVYDALQLKQNVITVTALADSSSITLADNTIYNGGTLTALTVSVPGTATNGFTGEFDFSSGSPATTFTSSNIVWTGDDTTGGTFTPATNKRYTCIVWYDGVQFVGTVIGV